MAPASLFHFYTVLSFNNIAPWRRFGFAFWGESRLSGYGFLHPDFYRSGIQRRTNAIFHYAWKSVLELLGHAQGVMIFRGILVSFVLTRLGW